MTADDIIAKAQRIFRPFELDVKEVVWWSITDLGHRLTDKFDDVPEAGGHAGAARDAGRRRLPYPQPRWAGHELCRWATPSTSAGS